jgi:hypothetical protein
MTGQHVTPVLTQHARERCAEMGIRTRVAKRIWQHWSMIRPLRGQNKLVVTSDDEPDYAIIVDDNADNEGERPVVVTVIFNHPETYVRDGETFHVIEETKEKS